jgi:hypothetical protein
VVDPIPHTDVAIADNELMDTDWYDFFRSMLQGVQALQQALDALPSTIPITPVTLTYGPTINIDAALSSNFILTVTNTSAFAFAAPTNPVPGAVINLTVKNAAGANIGSVTWNPVFKVPSVPPSWKPPNGKNRSLQYFYDGASWLLRYAGTEDVDN